MMTEPWVFSPLQRHGYRVILADPPWKFSSGPSRNPRNHYPTMTIEEIKALPVKDLAHPEGCRLLMWITMPLAHRIQEIIGAWGFRYSTARVWAKLWPSEDEMFLYPDSLARGTGYEVVGNCEMLVIAKRGRPERVPPGKQPASLFFARRRQHSRKPELIRTQMAALFDGPRCELFSRSPAPGWDAWGNETAKFVEAAE
jgi:N6-adenosine-specific RNA methylase IME4